MRNSRLAHLNIARHDKEIAKEIELMGIHVNSESMTMQRIIFSVLDDEI